MGGLQLHARVLANMALTHEECLYQDDFDAVLYITESNFLEYGDEFQQDMNWQLKKYLQLITHRPIHVLFAPKFAFQKVDSPGISVINIT